MTNFLSDIWILRQIIGLIHVKYLYRYSPVSVVASLIIDWILTSNVAWTMWLRINLVTEIWNTLYNNSLSQSKVDLNIY